MLNEPKELVHVEPVSGWLTQPNSLATAVSPSLLHPEQAMGPELEPPEASGSRESDSKCEAEKTG